MKRVRFPMTVEGVLPCRLKLRLALAALLAAGCTLAAAQTPIYESKDKSGPVFSDKPASGATQVDLPPPNVIQTPKLPPPSAKPAAAAPPPYRSLQITSLPDQGTIHTNTGAFELPFQLVPPLRRNAGDRVALVLDGRLVNRKFTWSPLHVTAADWGSAAGGDDVHTLQLAVVDPNGTLLIESATVQFYARRATVGRAR
jgi:hypothetical protein